MFNITLIAMGKLKEKFYLSAADEYLKRLKGYCQFQLIELPEVRLSDNPSPAEIASALEKEADSIIEKIPKGAWFCTFTPEGKMLSSEQFAEKLQTIKLSGKKCCLFFNRLVLRHGASIEGNGRFSSFHKSYDLSASPCKSYDSGANISR